MRPVLARYLHAAGRQAVVSLLLFLLLGAVTQGIAFALVVPITDGLFRPDAAAPWSWIAALAAVTVVYAVLHYRSVPMGNRLGADLVATLHRAVAERASALPNRSLDLTHTDRQASLDGTTVVVLMGLPAHVLRPLVAAVATPLTVIVISAFIDFRLALVLAAGLVALLAASFAAARLLTGNEEPESAEWLRRTYTPSAQGPGRPVPQRLSALLLPAMGEVLLWRVIELVMCGAVAVCVLLSTGDDLSAGTAVALVVLSVLMYQPVLEAALLTSTIMKSRDVLAMIGKLIDAGDAELPTGPWPESCDVEFDGVGLVQGATTVLADISFRLPAGTTTVLTGTPDGSRLALSDLMTGDLAPTSGRVRLGGVDIGTIATSEIDRRLGRVSPTAAGLTREDAVRFVGFRPAEDAAGGSPMSEAPSVRVAEERLRATLSDPAAPEGSPLPLPDRWRLALLRTLADDPAMVIVDATAGADVFTAEPDVADLLSALTQDRTCCLILGPGIAPPRCDGVLMVADTGASVRSPAVS